jgi:2',3'-cyclic-nucleotide 2'-phosphodiesterase (5'-nucleotidase family)
MKAGKMRRLRLAIFFLILTILSLTPAYGREVSLRILYVNDFHGVAEPQQVAGSQELLGGVAYLAHEVARLRQEKPTLLLAAGDMFQGNAWANLFLGESSLALMNLMGFDAMAVGNHDFDYGQEMLKKRINKANFPVLGANVEGLKGLKPYVIKEVQGLKVGVIGVVTPDTPVASHPKNVMGLKFLPPGAVLDKYLPELKKQADLVIVLSHIGYEVDRQLAAQVPGLGVIVGGHSHTKVLEPAVVNGAIIVQAWEYAKALGVLDLTLAAGKIKDFQGRLVMIKPEPGREDQAAARLVGKYAAQVNLALDKKVGEATVDLDVRGVRERETNVGNLIADIMRQTAGAQAAILNGGSLRADIAKGPITMKNIYAALPFDNYLVAIKLTGKQIRESLEHGVSGEPGRAGRFPQVSGLTFTYNPRAPVGARVREAAIAGEPLDPGKEYTVATNDFLAAGGDGYQAFGEALRSSPDFSSVGGILTGEKLVYNDASRWLRDVVIDYLRKEKKVAPRIEGRIKETE